MDWQPKEDIAQVDKKLRIKPPVDITAKIAVGPEWRRSLDTKRPLGTDQTILPMVQIRTPWMIFRAENVDYNDI